jgi:hypothetical protein
MVPHRFQEIDGTFNVCPEVTNRILEGRRHGDLTSQVKNCVWTGRNNRVPQGLIFQGASVDEFRPAESPKPVQVFSRTNP